MVRDAYQNVAISMTLNLKEVHTKQIVSPSRHPPNNSYSELMEGAQSDSFSGATTPLSMFGDDKDNEPLPP